MKIAILTLGTRGDVQPYIALGKALQARGHDVLLAAPENFAQWVTEHGLSFRSIGIDMQAFLQSAEVREVMAGNILAMIRIWKTHIVPWMKRSLQATWEAGRGADLIIYHPKTLAAVDVAEATGAALVSTSPIPLYPTSAFPMAVWTFDKWRWLNRLTYKLHYLARLLYRGIYNDWRKTILGLDEGPVFVPFGGEIGGAMSPRLCAVSPAVVPRPDDWDDGLHMTGYWFLDEGFDWRPDASLKAFLDAGETPVYIGFGSMTSRDPQKLARTIVDGVRRAGVRAILATGWGGVAEIDVPDSLYVIDSAPHEALFKHVAAVVHHGGAGTTAAGLRAGLPTLVCPLSVDQPFWGHRIWKLGCGPKPQSLRRLRSERFAKGLVALTQTPSYRERAQAVARAIAGEDGIANAVAVIDDVICRQSVGTEV